MTVVTVDPDVEEKEDGKHVDGQVKLNLVIIKMNESDIDEYGADDAPRDRLDRLYSDGISPLTSV